MTFAPHIEVEISLDYPPCLRRGKSPKTFENLLQIITFAPHTEVELKL